MKYIIFLSFLSGCFTYGGPEPEPDPDDNYQICNRVGECVGPDAGPDAG